MGLATDYPQPPEDYYAEPTEITSTATEFLQQCSHYVMRYLEEIPYRDGIEQVAFADYAIAEKRLTEEIETGFSEDPLGDFFALEVAIDLVHQRLETVANDELQTVEQSVLEEICFDLEKELRDLSSEDSPERVALIERINKGLDSHGLSITDE